MSMFKTLAIGNFIMVNREIAVKLGINAAVMIAELANEEQYYETRGELENGWFYSSINNIEEKTTLKRYKQDTAINALKEVGLVETKVYGMTAKRYFRLNESALLNLLGSGSHKPTNFRYATNKQNVGHKQTERRSQTNSLLATNEQCVGGQHEKKTDKRKQIKENSNKENIIKKYSRVSPGDTAEDINADVLEVVNYLNERCHKRYRATSKSVQKFITARLRDGATVEEMKAVIDVKAAQWENDVKMREYLRPETLFNETKFESYRQQIAEHADDELSWAEIADMVDRGGGLMQ